MAASENIASTKKQNPVTLLVIDVQQGLFKKSTPIYKAGEMLELVQDGHSSFSKDAGRLIAEWNEKLSARQVAVKATSEIMFG